MILQLWDLDFTEAVEEFTEFFHVYSPITTTKVNRAVSPSHIKTTIPLTGAAQSIVTNQVKYDADNVI